MDSKHLRDTPNYHPPQAHHFDTINAALNLTTQELSVLERNGFVVTDRLTFNEFKRAYAWIYWKDLPVLITTDSILHSIHQTYNELLKEVEMTLLTRKLVDFLTGTRDYLHQSVTSAPESFKVIYNDLVLYLTMPLLMLSLDSRWILNPYSKNIPEKVSGSVQHWMSQISQVNNTGKRFLEWDENENTFISRNASPVGIEEVTLFGLSRQIDFTQFIARGHYDEPPELVVYFCAMMWLQLIDFRLIEYDDKGIPHFHRQQMIAAHLLYEAIEKSGHRQIWDDINHLLTVYTGWSEIITLDGLERLISDMNITSPMDYWNLDEDEFCQRLVQNDYGQQRIRGQLQARANDYKDDLPHHISFALIGQRYTIESDILQHLVYDKLKVDGHIVERAYPSPLDVMAALGSERAWLHLKGELDKYGYGDSLKSLQTWASTHSDEFWQTSFYNLWLKAIVTLNQGTADQQYPRVMRSVAWRDKTLHTQLASWTELRHDNILYAKPPFSPGAICDYPDGYVEPYPDFYRALAEYARFGREVFSRFTVDHPNETYEQGKKRLGNFWKKSPDQTRPERALHLRTTAITYFDDLEVTMNTLERLANKELEGEAFDDQDILFMRSVIVRKYVSDSSYGGMTEENWTGWYNGLLPFGDETSRIVADVYSNHNSQIGEIGVLHLGLADPVMLIAIVDCGGKENLYVGPAFSLYEHYETGSEMRRLTDDDWRRLLNRRSAGYLQSRRDEIEDQNKKIAELESKPDKSEQDQRDIKRLKAHIANDEKFLLEASMMLPPPWTSDFRVPAEQHQQLLQLPNAYDVLKGFISDRLQTHLDQIHDTFYKGKINPNTERHVNVLVEAVTKAQEQILAVEGVDDTLLEELIEALYLKGHLKRRQ